MRNSVFLQAIYARDLNNNIGDGEKLLEFNKKDMQYFSKTTAGSVVIMGMKTFKTFAKPLKGRYHIVLTRDPKLVNTFQVIDGTTVRYVGYAAQALEWAETVSGEYPKVFVIGGAQIYNLFLGHIDLWHVTTFMNNFMPENPVQFIGPMFGGRVSPHRYDKVASTYVHSEEGTPFTIEVYKAV